MWTCVSKTRCAPASVGTARSSEASNAAFMKFSPYWNPAGLQLYLVGARRYPGYSSGAAQSVRADPALYSLQRVPRLCVEADAGGRGQGMNEVDDLLEQQQFRGGLPQAGADDHTVEGPGNQSTAGHLLRRITPIDETA